MSRGPDVGLGLVELLTDLEAELGKARSQADDLDLTFRVDGATVEVDVSYIPTESRDAPTWGKPEFWVVESAAPNTNDAPRRQTLRLSVHLGRWPKTTDADESEAVATPSLPPPVPLPKYE